MKVTRRQAAIIEFLEGFHAQNGTRPSQREMQDHFGWRSRNAVGKHLKALEKKGLIERFSGRARSVVVPSSSSDVSRDIPLLGSIPAGYPADQFQDVECRLPVDPVLFGLSERSILFGLNVRGDSMKDAAILNGDIAVIEVCEPRHRDIVAALIDGQVTLKRFLIEKGAPLLRAENAEFSDLTPAQELVIQGVLRGVIRAPKRAT